MKQTPTSRRRQSGLSLIELMIALVLGLIVVGAASAVFLSNRRVYGTSETVNRMQESSRVAFELMSRDVREAGGNPCSSSSTVVNQLATASDAWWQAFAQGIRGYNGATATPGTAFGSAAANRVNGTDAVDLHLANTGDYRVTAHTNPSAELDLNTNAGVTEGEILMVCNMDFALIFQATGLSSTNKVQHNGGGGSATPGNTCAAFKFDPTGNCTVNRYCMLVPAGVPAAAECDLKSDTPARMARVVSVRWYIGNNGRGSTSLYRATLTSKDADAIPDPTEPPVEIAEGVTDMNITYLSNGGGVYQAPAAVANWRNVVAARVSLTFSGVEGGLAAGDIRGTDGNVLTRTVVNTVALRNRQGVL